VKKSLFGSANSGMETPNSPRVFAGCLSASEMELSEDYTCVITHGPVPRTTHIFDNCIVESCCGVVGFSTSLKKDNNRFLGDGSSYPPNNFLSFCSACKNKLEQGKDIYMYRLVQPPHVSAFFPDDLRENYAKLVKIHLKHGNLAQT